MSTTIYYVQSFRYPEDGNDEGATTFESAHVWHASATARLLPLLHRIYEEEYEAILADLEEDGLMIRQDGFTMCEVCVVSTELIDGETYPRGEKTRKRRRTIDEEVTKVLPSLKTELVLEQSGPLPMAGLLALVDRTKPIFRPKDKLMLLVT